MFFFLMLETEESVDSHHILQEAPDRVIKRSPGNLSSQVHRLVTLEVLNLIYLIYKEPFKEEGSNKTAFSAVLKNYLL